MREKNSIVVYRGAQAAAGMQLWGEVLSGPGELRLVLMCSSPRGMTPPARVPLHPRVTGVMAPPKLCIILQGE